MPNPIGNASSSSSRRPEDEDTKTSTVTTSSVKAVTSTPTSCVDGSYAPCSNFRGYDPAEAAKNMAPAPPPTERLDGLGWGELDRRMRALTDKLTKSGPYSGREVDEKALLALEGEYARRKSFATSPAPAAPTDSTNHAVSVPMMTTADGSVKVGSVSAHADTKGVAGVDVAGVAVSGAPTQDSKVAANGFHAYADAGAKNVDGSTGFHVTAGANFADGETTYGNAKDGTVTLGLSWGLGFEGSLGIADNGALCYRLGAGPLLVGACTGETPTAAPAVATGEKKP